MIRLIAVAPTGNPNEFQVIAGAEASDNATTSPGNLLSLTGLPPFSFAIFQTTTEQEGFDNLNFTTVPEPVSYALLALGLGALGMMRRRGGSERADQHSGASRSSLDEGWSEGFPTCKSGLLLYTALEKCAELSA